MREYHKIQTVYERSREGDKRLIDGLFRDATVAYLSNLDWVWTEKVDGTNIRVHWDGHAVEFGGRTDRAQIPAELVNKLNDLFGGETNAQMFEQLFGTNEVTLYGEGYGRKIQGCGSLYIPDGVNFILFDVMIGENFMGREAVEEIARALGIDVVPVILVGTVDEAIEYVKGHPDSHIGDLSMEGLVGRPMWELKDRCGNRIILKVKWKDFK